MAIHPNIRPYVSKDKPALLGIFKLNVPVSFAESEIRDFDQYLYHGLEKYFIAELNGEIIGAGGINFEDSGRTGVISWDFIHPNQQGRGIGSRLLKHRLRILESMAGVEKVIVRTSQFAYPFYKKHGFATEKVEEDYWAPGFNLYKMRYVPGK